MPAITKSKLGVSACLLGKKVRYDGGHKRSRTVTTLGRRFTLVPVCPEVEAGLSIPREPMMLTGRKACPRLVVISSGLDLTDVLNDWVRKKVRKLAKEKLCGFILKSRSPSCAIDDAEIISRRGAEIAEKKRLFQNSVCSTRDALGPGLFSVAVMERYPGIPIINEEDLADPDLRKDFIGRVLEYK